jgi:Domain of unknown function (DUF1707)
MTSPNPHPGVRAGDRERTAVADRLAAHAAAGRLTVDELEQRVERAHAAVHTTDLDALLADLPERSRTPDRRRRAPGWAPYPFIGAAFVAAIIATVALSIAVGHPVPPVFLLVLLVWRLRWRLS